MTSATTLTVIFEKSMYALRIGDAIGTTSEWMAVMRMAVKAEHGARVTGAGYRRSTEYCRAPLDIVSPREFLSRLSP